ncbi:MAG: sulfotransferase domain-containing protein [Rhodospirillaceae bacterium]|nr:sulfotransferase domain-containing protein [Rhodospirillaceae bacterium]
MLDFLRPAIPRYPLLVGTHHKTGTVWMRRIFSEWCRRVDISFHDTGVMRPICAPATVPGVYFDFHSAFPPALLQRRFRGVHLIRDPRDVVISAAHYHARTDNPERWLHAPNPQFGGLGYAAAIGRLEPEDRLRFEMEHASGNTIRAMAAWNYADARFANLRYEALIGDRALDRFRWLFGFLGLRRHALASALRAVQTESLFSATFEPGDDPEHRQWATTHVRSGAPRQWEREFTRRLGERFVELFGNALVALGYEPDNGWVEKLPR